MSKKYISDGEFEIALNSIDNKLIMEKVAWKFRRSLDSDELYRCKLIALWKSLQEWNSGKRKFTTHLYQKLIWECIQNINNNKSNKNIHTQVEKAAKPKLYIMELLENLSPELQNIVIQRYIYCKTYREIAKEHNFSTETARRRVIKGIEILQKSQKSY